MTDIDVLHADPTAFDAACQRFYDDGLLSGRDARPIARHRAPGGMGDAWDWYRLVIILMN